MTLDRRNFNLQQGTSDDSTKTTSERRLSHRPRLEHRTTPQELELLAISKAEQLNNNTNNSYGSNSLIAVSSILQEQLDIDDDNADGASSEGSLSTEDMDDTDDPLHHLIAEENNNRNNHSEDNKKNLKTWRPHIHKSKPIDLLQTHFLPTGQRSPELDVEQYSSKRKMTLTQERWNAITMIPSPIYCIYYILAGVWVGTNGHSSTVIGETLMPIMDEYVVDPLATTALAAPASSFSSSSCLPPSRWYSMPALPPLPVVAVAFAIALHAPFSFIYHWKYAVHSNLSHWSRRLDQSFIHVASALVSYSTSGSWDYFLANLLYNADCIYRQFLPRVRPRMNQLRIFISILAYTFPILRRGDLLLFTQAWTVLGIGGWLFAKYPIGGWSHCAFHFVMCFLPPLIMEAATELPASQAQMQVAAHCAALLSRQQMQH